MLDREKTVSWPLLLVFPVVVSLSELFGVRTALCEEQLPSFEFIKSAPDVFERTIDYMVTVSLALFGLVGYSFTILSSAVDYRVKITAYLSLLLFVICDATSLIFAYLSRTWLISRLAVGQFDYERTGIYMFQAESLLIASAAACVFWVVATLTRDQ
jgi:hypothetical protein